MADGVSATILDTLAQDQSVEDSMTVVKGAFRAKKISLDQYLRAIRELSEDKFFLIEK